MCSYGPGWPLCAVPLVDPMTLGGCLGHYFKNCLWDMWEKCLQSGCFLLYKIIGSSRCSPYLRVKNEHGEHSWMSVEVWSTESLGPFYCVFKLKQSPLNRFLFQIPPAQSHEFILALAVLLAPTREWRPMLANLTLKVDPPPQPTFAVLGNRHERLHSKRCALRCLLTIRPSCPPLCSTLPRWPPRSTPQPWWTPPLRMVRNWSSAAWKGCPRWMTTQGSRCVRGEIN